MDMKYSGSSQVDAANSILTEGAVMENQAADGLIVLLTSGAEDEGKRATLAFVAACSALAIGKRTQVFLTGDGSHWGFLGNTEGVQSPGFPPLEDLVQDFLDLGGSLAMCSTCHEYCALPDLTGENRQQRREEVNLSGFTAVIASLSTASSLTF